MDDTDIYRTPHSNVELADQEPDFYIVAKWKFFALYILTFGLYSVYWFYANWKRQQPQMEKRIYPVMRGIFSIFFVHALFNRITEAARARDVPANWSGSTYATLFVIVAITANVLDRISMGNETFGILELVSLALLVLLGVLVYQAQRMINLVCNDPDGSSNGRLTIGNVPWMLIGGLLWGGMVFGVYIQMVGM